MSHQGYQPLSTKDVVFVEGLEQSAALFKSDATLRVKDLLSKIEAICTASGQLSPEEVSMLFGHGINCELLRPGATDWQQGRLLFNLGFQSADVAALEPIAVPVLEPIAVPVLKAITMTGRLTTSEHPIVPTPAAVVVPAPAAAPAPPAATMTDRRSETIEPPVISLPAPQNAVVASPSNTSSVVLDRSSVTTPIAPAPDLADETPELDLASFANVIELHAATSDEADLDLDHSDVFSLMDQISDVTPLDDDFTFPEGLEGIEELNFDVLPTPKSISSPWDLEELDGMLMVK
jgi:hypothetical protein